MARLPTVGGDSGNWGTVLNEYLAQAHNADGSLKGLATDDVVAGSVARTYNSKLSEVVSIKEFGAVGDGITDDTAALQAAFNSPDLPGGRVHVPPGVYIYTTKLLLRSGLHITGDPGATLKWTGAGSSSSSAGTLELREAGIIADPSTFSTDVSICSLRFESVNKRTICILAVNIRGIKVTDCTFYNCGGLRVAHERQINGSYVVTNNAGSGDPAVEAGFSSTLLNDLSENIVFSNNKVNGVSYFVMACRLDFCKKFVVANNICEYSTISWWGGSARNDSNGYGGLKTFLRRCTQGTIANNYCSWGNGGIYGNNGSHLAITGNVCEFIVDTGIDLEGCMFCTVTGNSVKYCGNFCMSTFYVTLGNVFSGNTLTQAPTAANMNTQAGTTDYPSSLGRHLFKQVSAFAETELNTVSLSDNQFVWEGASGFGVIQIDSRTCYSIDNNTLRNVVVDARTQAASTNGSFKNNKLTFSNTPTVANAVYIVMGSNQDPDTLLNVFNNEVYCTNELASTIIIFTQAKAFNGLVVTRIERNTIMAATSTYPVAFGDVRTRTGTPPKMSFLIKDNIIKSGTIKDLGIVSATANGGYTPTVIDGGNYTTLLGTSVVDATPDTTVFANMAFGVAVV